MALPYTFDTVYAYMSILVIRMQVITYIENVMDQRFALNTYTTGAMMFQIKICIVNVEIISSLERKAQVSFPDQIRPLSLVIVFVVLVVVVINFSYFHLLQNH